MCVTSFRMNARSDETGRRSGLKIRRLIFRRTGSTPVSGTRSIRGGILRPSAKRLSSFRVWALFVLAGFSSGVSMPTALGGVSAGAQPSAAAQAGSIGRKNDALLFFAETLDKFFGIRIISILSATLRE